jgi:hypothetical protein
MLISYAQVASNDQDTAAQVAALKAAGFYRGLQPANEDPMLDFEEWDLVRLAKLTGFETIIANLRLNILADISAKWEDFIAFQASSNVPSLSDAIGQMSSNAEREMLETHLRPLIAQGRGRIRQSGFFL